MYGGWVSIISLLGWLVLAVCALNSERLGFGKLVKLAVIWVAIFFGVAFVVSLIGF